MKPFDTREEAEQTEIFKSNDFARFYYDTLTKKYLIEQTNLGPILTWQKLLKLGNNI